MSLILGINAYHGDASAAIFRDGQLLAAVEEERFRRIKHWAGLPVMAMQYCIDQAGVAFDDLEHIAINTDPGVNHGRRLLHVLRHLPSPKLLIARLAKLGKTRSLAENIAEAFQKKELKAQIHYVEHHLAHLASSYLCSPFQEAACLSVDGMGDFASAAWGYGQDGNLEVDGKVYFPHSLGIFYSALTQWLGFPHYGDEYKVMGLAPYGEPRFLEQMRKIVLIQGDGSFKLDLTYFRHHREAVPYSWDTGSPTIGTLFSDALEDLLGPARRKDEPLTQEHRDIARSVQAMQEEAFFALLEKLYGKHPSTNITLSGGCAMNSVANGKVAQRSKFKNVYIQSAAGDAGGAIGAALIASQRVMGTPIRSVMSHAYYGPEYTTEEIQRVLELQANEITSAGCEVLLAEDTADLCKHVAQAISEGQVIGWFQGRMEWGPRALGNRSILGDPRRADMKDILNAKIKRRESFRPFAPSILREEVSNWFESDGDVPFMMQVFQIREDKRIYIPAVTHVDGSGRLQTVHQDTNPLYHQLISEFQNLTGVPMVLNTSFNENEPVVCRPEEALHCFLRTNMDCLAIGPYLLRRNSESQDS